MQFIGSLNSFRYNLTIAGRNFKGQKATNGVHIHCTNSCYINLPLVSRKVNGHCELKKKIIETDINQMRYGSRVQ